MAVRQISVFVENRIGSLYDITNQLAKYNINIKAVSLADTTRFGIFRLIVDDCDACEKALTKEGFTVSAADVIAVELSDKPGGLRDAINILYENGMNLDYIYAFIHHTEGIASVIIKVGDIEFAENVLKNSGFRLLNDADIRDLL